MNHKAAYIAHESHVSYAKNNLRKAACARGAYWLSGGFQGEKLVYALVFSFGMNSYAFITIFF